MQLTCPILSNGKVKTRRSRPSGTPAYRTSKPAQTASHRVLLTGSSPPLPTTAPTRPHSDPPDNGYIGYLFSTATAVRLDPHGQRRCRQAAASGPSSRSGVADQWYVGFALVHIRSRPNTTASGVVSAPGQAFSALTIYTSPPSPVSGTLTALVRKGAVVDSIATVVTPSSTPPATLPAASPFTQSGQRRRCAAETYGGANTGIATPPAPSSGDELFVTNHHVNTITVHDINAAGDAPPKCSISGNLSNLRRMGRQRRALRGQCQRWQRQVYNSSDNGNAVVPRVLGCRPAGWRSTATS